ncbi:MAG: cytochrome P450 [Actinomycetota bacterium]
MAIDRERYLIGALRQGSRTAVGRAALQRYLAPMNPFDVRRSSDPYPFYRKLHERGPVVHHRALDMWLISGYDEASASLRADVSCDRSDMAVRLYPYSRLQPATNAVMLDNVLMQDAPRHTELRRAMSTYFAPAAIAHLAELARSAVHQRLDELDGSNPVEVMSQVLRPVSSAVNARVLGVPSARTTELNRLAGVLARYGEPLAGFTPQLLDDGVCEVDDLYERYAVEEPAAGSLWAHVAAADRSSGADGALDLRGSFALQLIAGHETMVGLMGNALVALATDRSFRAQLAEGSTEERIDAVEELARFDSPIQVTDRTLLADVELGGQRIEAGAVLLVLYGAANRDPAHFVEPDRLVTGRSEVRSLSFGAGIHRCLGVHLGVAVAAEVLSAFLARFPNYRIAPDGVRWLPTFTLRGPAALTVELR